jgi:hypothetical protein
LTSCLYYDIVFMREVMRSYLRNKLYLTIMDFIKELLLPT